MKRTLLYIALLLILSCQEENQPPECIILNPSHKSSFNIGDTISVEISAIDHDGSIDDVRLLFDGSLLATLTSSPYHYEISSEGYEPGNYMIQAIARDGGDLESMDEIQIGINTVPPKVITGNVDSITLYSVLASGEVLSDGGLPVIARGICWNTLPNPSLSNHYTIEGFGIGAFESTIDNLLCETQYYIRAYATNEMGTSFGDQVSFTTAKCYALPTVITGSVSSITDFSAICGGEVIDNGGAHVIDRGICWDTVQEPKITDSKISIGTGLGGYSGSITGLGTYTKHYVRAYATNNTGTGYGDEISFVTLWDNSAISDYDGNTYGTIQIGDQIWMQENLEVIHYSDGTPIQLVEDNEAWEALGHEEKAYCWYYNNISNKDIFGGLYTWAAAMNGAESSNTTLSYIQGVCPDQWHLPSDLEWTQLEIHLGMSQAEADELYTRGTDEGGKLKEIGTTLWAAPNVGATNESGFSALPGSGRLPDGTFGDNKYFGRWWSSSESNIYNAWFRYLSADHAGVYKYDGLKREGFSVRCIKDSP